MNLTCPNTSSPAWKALVERIGVREAYREYLKHAGTIPNADSYQETFKGVNATLKIVSALEKSPRTNYPSNQIEGFYNDLRKYGAPENQINLLKDYIKANGIQEINKVDLIAGLLGGMAYTVEIETTKQHYRYDATDPEWREDGTIIHEGDPSQHYLGMTVPGGTNYTENEIRTPDITPSIKGHAEFATDKGIGWFRADSQVIGGRWLNSYNTPIETPDDLANLDPNDVQKVTVGGTKTNIRRILEVQSDLFQKGRDKVLLSGDVFAFSKYLTDNQLKEYRRQEELIRLDNESNKITPNEHQTELDELRDKFQIIAQQEKAKTSNEHKFLDLLRKDNNWVTFFVKAIIQDSAKKGYEKVLFPIGDTAAKIEGHDTMETIIADRKRRIAEYLDIQKKIETKTNFKYHDQFVDFSKKTINDDAKDFDKKIAIEVASIKRGLEQFQLELEQAESGTMQVSSIAKFYEETIFNILKKQGYNPERIADEYGNGWYQVDMNEKAKQTILFNRQLPASEFEKKALEYLVNEGILNRNQMRLDGKSYWVVRRTQPGSYNIDTNNVVYILNDNLKKLEVINQSFYERNGWKPFSVREVAGNSYAVEVNSQAAIFNKDNASAQVGDTLIGELAVKLSERFGIDHELITEESARDLLGDDKYNEEGAFFYQGKVFFVEGKNTLENVLHEFSHPLILGLRKYNSRVYDNIFNDLATSKDADTQRFFRDVEALYPEFGKNSNEFKDEVIVRALTAVAEGKLNKVTLGNVWQKIWYYIKEMLRSVFGKNLRLETLSENTNLKDLANMLAFGKKDLSVTTQSDYTLFNREMAEELANISNNVVVKNIELFSEALRDHINKLSNNQNYKELREILKGRYGESILGDINYNLIETAKRYENEVDKQFKKLRNFSEAVLGIKSMSEKMRDHVNSFRGSDMSEQEQLRSLTYYSYIVKDWSEVFDSLRKDVSEDYPIMSKEIQSTIANFKRIQDYTHEVFKRGVLEVMVKELSPVKEFADKEYIDRIADLETRLSKGEKNVKDLLDRLKKEYTKFDLTEDNIMKYLQGEMGDTNAFSAILESYTSSPDPIVGGFASFMSKNFYRVESIVQQVSTELRKELAPLYKEYGVDRSNPEKLGKELTTEDTVFTRNKDNEPEGLKVYVLSHEFQGGWQYDYKTFEHKIDQAVEQEDTETENNLRKQFGEFKEKYFNREYKAEIYEAKKFWWTDEMTQNAYKKRKEITDQLKSFEGYNELDAEDITEIEQLQKELRTLGSVKNLDGTDKDGESLEIAKAIRKYQDMTRGFYEEFEIKGAFERSYQSLKDDLEDKRIAPDTPEYDKLLNNWLKDNIRVRLSDKFYEDRQRILDEISAIVNTLGREETSQIYIGDKWKEIIEQVKGFRDQDGQPIGSDLSDPKVAQVKRLQEAINEIRANLKRLNGLTSEEDSRLGELINVMKSGNMLNQEEQTEYSNLIGKRDVAGLTSVNKGRLFSLFDELTAFQSKVPTNYYVDEFNKKAEDASLGVTIDAGSVEDLMKEESMKPLLDKDADFARWFKANHILKTVWNRELQQMESIYERLYIWNRIVPNDPAIKSALARNSYKDLLAIQHPHFSIKYASKYYFYRIKNEFKTPKEVGKTIDNRGNWLPLLDAADKKYVNQGYLKLKSSTDPRDKTRYKILETYKAAHIAAQETAPKYARLWMELPRLRRQRLENVNDIVSDPGQTLRNMVSWAKAGLSRAEDDFDRNNLSPAEVKAESKLYVMTDLLGNEIHSIPVKHMSKLPIDTVSLDIGRSIMKYITSLEINKMLHNINPIARALQKVLGEEGVKDINKISSRNWVNKHFNLPVRAEQNRRLTIINNMIEREIEGIENKMEIGTFGNKVAQHMMGLAAFGMLAMNIPSGIKNVVTARVQNMLESVTGRYWTTKEWMEASGVFMRRFLPKLIYDYNTLSGREDTKSLETQLFELMDPVQGKYSEHIGSEFSSSYRKDIVNLRFTSSPQKLGEINAQGSAMIALMEHEKVPITIDGKTTEIRYIDAWEKRDGLIQLKSGVPEEYGRTGGKFLSTKLKLHKINELLQGAYAPLNQPEVSRYTLGRLGLFMRRYFTPGIINRFSVKRPNIALGSTREGYYITFVKMARDMIKNGKDNWHLYNKEEKRNFWRTMIEMGYSLTFFGLISLLGFNNNDPDRYNKLKENSWAHNMLLYELTLIKGEVETFIPLPGMGMNELLRMKDTPSIAMPIMNKYYKFLSHFIDLIEQPFTSQDITHYRRSSGFWQKGDLKLKADLFKIFGFTGASFDPKIGIKNYNQTMNRYN